MITLLRSQQRQHVHHDGQDTWRTAYPAAPDGPAAAGVRLLVALDEIRLSPGSAAEPHLGDEAEWVTYVHAGSLSQEDSVGNSSVLHAGEFQRMFAGRRVRHRETNASSSDRVVAFRLSLWPSRAAHYRPPEQSRFTAAERRNVLCAVASPDGRRGSLRIRQDVLVCSSLLEPGRHVVHELLPGHSAWLHVIGGEGALDDVVLRPGDGVCARELNSVSFTARTELEVLLVVSG